MNNAIDITLENTGVVMEVENFDTENNTILVSLSRNGVDADVDSVAPSITVDFGSLPQNVYWDEIQDKPNFHEVATSGDYNDLENTPNLHPVATSGNYNDLSNRPNLKPVATSGDYDDLTGKPKINNVTLDGNKSAADLGLATAAQGAKADTAYQKPIGGIPGSDMSAAVQSALEKAETALQEHQSLEGYATEAWVEDQGYLTEHQDISGKADKSDTYTKQEVDAKMASAMHYKGSVANYDALLLIQDAEVGDMYNVLDTGHNYAWDGAAWDIQSGIVDLSGKQDTLVSGENIKTINGESILGSGNLVIEGGGGEQSDWEEDDSTEPSYVQNRPAVRAGSGTNAIIEGNIANNEASGDCSHAEGTGTKSIGTPSHSEGYGTVSYGNRTHAEGFGYANAPQYYPNAPFKLTGNANSSNYTVDIIEGIYKGMVLYYNGVFAKIDAVDEYQGTFFVTLDKTLDSENALSNATVKIVTGTASGLQSHSEGGSTRAYGSASHSEGNHTIATNSYEHAQGNYNKSNQATSTFGNAGNTLNSIGIGTSESNRKNAVEVMQNGDMYVYGLGNYDGTNIASASTLQEVVRAGGGGGGYAYVEGHAVIFTTSKASVEGHTLILQ